MISLDNIFNLKGKVIVITGGSGYLCGNLVNNLYKLGCKLVVIDKNQNKNISITNKFSKSPSNYFFLKSDVTIKNNFKLILKKTIDRFKKVDVLINGAGVNAPTPIFDITENEWNSIFDTHLKGTLFGCQVFGEHMIKQKKGCIINFSSASANPPLSKAFAYSAAKAGIKNLSQNLAREWAKNNVRVNSLRPGFFPTEWSKKKFLDKKRINSILNHTPMGRFGKPNELLGAVIWLCSDSSSFVTGAEIPIDGGFSAMTI